MGLPQGGRNRALRIQIVVDDSPYLQPAGSSVGNASENIIRIKLKWRFCTSSALLWNY